MQTFLGFLVGAIVSTSIAVGISRAYLARRLHGTGHLEVELGTLVFAVACIVASHLADFVPGYFYGVVAVFVATVEPPDVDKGRIATIAAAVTLSLAVVAWLLLVPLDHLAHGGNLFAQLPRSLAGGLFSGGTEALAIGLTPIRFLPGATLKRWNVKVWGAFSAAGLFLFTLGLLHPGLASTHEASVGWTLGLAFTFGAGSIAFWAYFRNRAAAPAAGTA